MTTIITALLMPLLGAIEKPPPIDTVCFSVTNYWPFDESNQLVAFNGQADSDPYRTANMTLITGPEQAWQWVAAPLPLVGSTITVPGFGTFPVNDTFGHPVYQAGVFWHDGYQEWVIGVDIFTPEPIHQLVCGGTINN